MVACAAEAIRAQLFRSADLCPRLESALNLPDALTSYAEAAANFLKAEPRASKCCHLPLSLSEQDSRQPRNLSGEFRTACFDRRSLSYHGQFLAARYPASSAAFAFANSTRLCSAMSS